MVSHQRGPSHYYIFWTISGSKYLLSKAMTWGIHVDLIRDNIWGGLPWKHWSDAWGENNCWFVFEVLGCCYNNFIYKEGCEAHTYRSGELWGTSHSLFTKDACKLLTALVFMFTQVHYRFLCMTNFHIIQKIFRMVTSMILHTYKVCVMFFCFEHLCGLPLCQYLCKSM
jgi:hypothetical protein